MRSTITWATYLTCLSFCSVLAAPGAKQPFHIWHGSTRSNSCCETHHGHPCALICGCSAGPSTPGCNAQQGFIPSLGGGVREGANNIQSSASACCSSCKSTADCNVWTWCSNPKGQEALILLLVKANAKADWRLDNIAASPGTVEIEFHMLRCCFAGCHSMYQQCWLGDKSR